MLVLLRRLLVTALVLVPFAAAPTAQAAPVLVNYTLQISFGFESPWPNPLLGSGMVDVSGGTLTIPAGLIAIPSIVVAVSGTTGVSSPLVFENLMNQTGTFRAGGVASQAPSELCPASGTGFACNLGGGVGGTMALSGSLSIPIIPNIIVIPVDFGAAGVGAGGSTNSPFGGADGAAWTTATARTVGATHTASFFGTSGPGSLTLVTPTYIAFFDSFLTFHLTLSPITLVPEPAGLVLLAFGSFGLWLTLRH